uniref:DUF1977 domain-containing protein n=1 Tax=Plectus sambesii TaxID=2011161 RepID=A0A914WFL8_9BILA
MDANRAEAQRCVDIARQHLAQGNADKAKKFLLKARKLHHEVDVDDLLRKVNGEGGGGGMGSKSEEGGASSEEHPTANGYAHFDHYNDPSNLRSRRGKFNSSQSQPSFGQDNAGQSSSSTTANGSASKEKAKAKPKANRSRTRSADGTPKLGVDFTQEEYDIVQRIRHCKDYYEILNVKKDATEAQLKKEYRKLALQLHPDKCRAPHSTEAFKALGNAYAVLSDTEKRQRYDMYGADQVQSQPRRRQSEFYEYDFGRGFEAEFTPEEIFNMFFGGGYPSGAMNRRRGGGGGTFHYQQQHAHQQPEVGDFLSNELLIRDLFPS